MDNNRNEITNNTQTFTCPHCNTEYNNTINNNNSLNSNNHNNCQHLLCSYQFITKTNSIYISSSTLTANVNGNQIPLVIAKRYIRFIRDRNGNTPLTGFYTIHQSKSRISNTFQGITSFSLNFSQNNTDSNLAVDPKQSQLKSIESTYYLTVNPIQDLLHFESFVLMNYKSNSLPTINLSISLNTNNRINVDNNNESNIINFSISNEQIKSFLNRIDDETDDYYESQDEDFHRWIMISGLPNQLPNFILISNNELNNSVNNQYNFTIPFLNSTINNNNTLQSIDLKIIPLVELPKVAAFN